MDSSRRHISEKYMGDVWPIARPGDRDANMGIATISPEGAFAADSLATFRLAFEVGELGIDDCGAIKVVFRFTYDGGDLQFTDPGAENYVSATTAADADLELEWERYGHQRPWEKSLRVTVRRGFLRKGDRIEILFGDGRHGCPGFRLQTFAESSFAFKVLVDVCATGQFIPLASSPSITVLPGNGERWKAVLPTLRRPGDEFALLIKLEDRWGNPAFGDGEMVSLRADPSIKGLPDHVQFQKGLRFIRIDGLSSDVEGDYTIEVRSGGGQLQCISNPISIRDVPHRSYWGDLHGQSGETVGVNSIDEYFEFGRDLAALDVMGHQANDFQVKDEFWKKINATTAQYNKNGEFVVFPGYEWSANSAVGGDHNVYYKGEGQPLVRSSNAMIEHPVSADSNAFRLGELFRSLKSKDCIVFAHIGGRPADISMAHDPELRTAVEVHSDWGTFEWLIAESFALNYRHGIVCNSDDHKGRPGASYPGASEFGAYGGLTCFLAENLSRDSIFESLRRRHHYGTTGSRLHLHISAAFDRDIKVFPRDPTFSELPPFSHKQAIMGDIAAVSSSETEVSIEVSAQAPIERIEIFNGTRQVVDQRMYEESHLGSRIRIVWEGAKNRGRGRRTDWSGRFCFDGAVIRNMTCFNVWNHTRTPSLKDQSTVEIGTTTTGNFSGIDLWVEEKEEASVNIDTNLVKDKVRLFQIGMNDVCLDAGGLGQRIRLFRLPEQMSVCTYKGNYPITLHNVGDNQIWTKVTTVDGHVAWSSPMYLFME